MFWSYFWPHACVQKVQRQHAGEHINVLSDPGLKYRQEVSGIIYNNLLNTLILYWPYSVTRDHNLHLMLGQPDTVIPFLRAFLQGYDETHYLKSYPPNVNCTIQTQ